jgi:hypothetical protein
MPCRAVLCCAALCCAALFAGETWWEVLPEELRDTWRRKASSTGSSGGYVFTPSAADLRWPEDFDADADATPSTPDCWDEAAGWLPEADAVHDNAAREQALRCCWARVLIWARWSLGEPVIVREAEVGASRCWQ